jgi:hypothetical protein
MHQIDRRRGPQNSGPLTIARVSMEGLPVILKQRMILPAILEIWSQERGKSAQGAAGNRVT